jgi:hypothetical protein
MKWALEWSESFLGIAENLNFRRHFKGIVDLCRPVIAY